MTEKYKNKYRIKSTRLPHWDYGNNGIYFITICTQNRQHFFGEIIDGEMQLNEIGGMVDQYWNEIPQHFPFVELGEFVVMPNHTHGVLIIDRMGDDDDALVETTVETRLIASLPGGFSKNNNPMLHENISRIIRWFKGRCTYEIRKNINPDFAWQFRFHDHIIRNEKSFHTISNYIINNPLNWEKDELKNPDI